MLTRGLLHFCFWAKVLFFKKGWKQKNKTKQNNQKEKKKKVGAKAQNPVNFKQVYFADGHLMQASAGGCVNIKQYF